MKTHKFSNMALLFMLVLFSTVLKISAPSLMHNDINLMPDKDIKAKSLLSSKLVRGKILTEFIVSKSKIFILVGN